MEQRQWILIYSALISILLVSMMAISGWLWSQNQSAVFLIFLVVSTISFILLRKLSRQFSSEKEHILKEQTRLKRVLEEYHLITEKQDFDSNHAKDLVKAMKKEVQEKNSILVQLAQVLSESMAEQIESLGQSKPDLELVLQRAYRMRKFSLDLDTLAQLSFPIEHSVSPVERFEEKLQACIEEIEARGGSTGLFFDVKTEEEQILIRQNERQLHQLLINMLDTVVRLNDTDIIKVGLITYIDAELGNSVRVVIKFQQISNFDINTGEFFSKYQKVLNSAGKDISPGLAPVIIQVLTGYLGGNISYNVTSEHKSTLILVLPLNEHHETNASEY